MGIVTAYSVKPSVEEAVGELKTTLSSVSPRLVLYFASTVFPPDAMAGKMQEAFPGAVTMGCTTAGEIVTGKMLKQSVAAMALDASVINDVSVAVIENVKNNAGGIKAAVNSLADYYGVTSARALSTQRFFGLILADGLSGAEERVMDKIGDLTNVTFVGGSAGDDLKFACTQVFVNGRACTNAAVLALAKSAVPFDFIKTQSFRVTDRKLKATKADEAKRLVLEFDGKQAAAAYAAAIGCAPEDLPNRFMHNPVGLIIDGEPFVRSPQRIENGNIYFYCNILEGTELAILEATDIVKDTREAIEKKKKELGGISGIVNFNCILRTLELDQTGRAQAYGAAFSDIPTVGFSTYGEEYLGHINQTATMLVFK